MAIDKTATPLRGTARALGNARRHRHGRWNSATGGPGGKPARRRVSTPSTGEDKSGGRRHWATRDWRGKLHSLISADQTALAHYPETSPRRRISLPKISFLTKED
jgi:hypothetical protein